MLIECAEIGGTCINVGCTPTKTMVASARVAYLARRAKDRVCDSSGITGDLSAVRARKQRVVESFRNGSTERVQRAGMRRHRGGA